MVDANIDLFAKFEVNQFNASTDLFAEFRATVHFSGQPRNLFAQFFRGADANQDLYAQFNVVATKDLFAKFTTMHSASRNLFAEFRPVVHFGEGWKDLKSVFLPARSAYAELYAELAVRQIGDADFKGVFIVRQTAEEDLFSEIIIRHSAAEDLLAEFIVRQSAFADLAQQIIIRHTGTPLEVFAQMEIEPALPLYARFIVRHTTTVDLKGLLYIRHPYWLWTTRRYINGVIDMAESLIGDAKLEYVVEGVMEDIQGYLAANALTYESWSDITTVPVLIRRATTYGTVAALYARHSKTFRSRVIPTVAPVTITTIGDDERAMRYWQDKMDVAMANYLSTISSPILWVSTADEEPVFTMVDIPLNQWNPADDLLEWHTWLNQRNY